MRIMRKERRGLESERHVVRSCRRERWGRVEDRAVRVEEELGGRKVEVGESEAVEERASAFKRLRRRWGGSDVRGAVERLGGVDVGVVAASSSGGFADACCPKGAL